MGENETFCRCMYVGDELNGQLVSSAFYRMSPAEGIPSGYLYAWLSSDYGFRLIRSTQYGTKQCYPNPKLLYTLPVPILEKKIWMLSTLWSARLIQNNMKPILKKKSDKISRK